MKPNNSSCNRGLAWSLRSSDRLLPVPLFFCALTGALTLTTTLASPAFADGTVPRQFSGKCSWYGPGFDGKKTASGELFDMKKCTAAHLKLKFGTKVLVENPRTGKTVVVKINDRGPYAKGRIMDISRGAAEKLGTLLGGVTFVDCTVLDKDSPQAGMTQFMIISGYTSDDEALFVADQEAHPPAGSS